MYFNSNINKIDDQIRQLQQLKNQMSNSMPMIQQNFLQNGFISDFDSKWINSIEEVKNTLVSRDTIFMKRDESIFYIKSVDNNIKTYKFEEIIEKSENDLLKEQIANLTEEIEKLKKREAVENEPIIQQHELIDTVPTIQKVDCKSKPRTTAKQLD